MNHPPQSVLFESSLPLELLHRGKVRDIYALDDQHILIVTSDRLSAFDVVLPQGIPAKGEVLTRLTRFWFARIGHLVANHMTADKSLEQVITDPQQRAVLGQRAMIVKKLKPLPLEAIVRGYLIGSGWSDYRATGAVCGIVLPQQLRQADKLPQAIYTPSSKAAAGEHDENLRFEQTVELVGAELAEQVKQLSLQIYTEAAEYARQRGIIIADTKFEFGLDQHGKLHLIDEVLTPDSSRFWPAEQYQPGSSPPSYDKQFVRDYLATLDWDKTPPAPELPAEIIRKTAEKYAQAEQQLSRR